MTTEVREAPVLPERVTEIRPSEALRLGRLTRPRRTEGYELDGADGACARGAMIEAIGGENFTDVWVRWPGLRRHGHCPVGFWLGDRTCAFHPDRASASVFYLVTHVNDTHHWSDDQIVEWLRGMGL